ncbi:FAD-binding protein [Aureimonas fodinaquatilis]|uniref:FAD-binding protein n=1 Tax=Aureimonas fodinaquatilis TaxID=2565783 RepID=A0A5B0E094_9HYPH|nr:FAD-binding protein [Aureimonas fodinaquatilis]KAA0970899.1 FAD-binding protein [Aureimonas fodinaquatilis]
MKSLDLDLAVDVLVVGGGPAGLWAAISAAQTGARVAIVEKGYVGTSGPFSSANTGIYYIKPDDPVHRDGTVEARLPLAFGLADKLWIERTFDQSYANLDAMARWGYKWPRNENDQEYRGRLRGPDVLIFLRRRLQKLGVRILDHCPALELLSSRGLVAGAAGIQRQKGGHWRVEAGATVLATGGTAFLSPIAGGRGNTGDGYLMAAEAGARFSGMEFSSQYAPTALGGVLSRGAHLDYGSLFDNDGQPIMRGRQTVEAIIRTGGAWAILDKARDAETRDMVRKTHAHIILHLERLGIDPFTQRFPIDFRSEGTIRAAGGVLFDHDLSTDTPGLFVAGDLATRERVTGAGPPGGGPAASWAFASGSWAGRSAAVFARQVGTGGRKLEPLGQAGLRPGTSRQQVLSNADILASVQSEMLPFDRNYWRNGPALASSLSRFADEWNEVRNSFAASQDTGLNGLRQTLRTREAAAMLVTARFINASALQRPETRGLHRRSDFPDLDPAQTHHLISGGLDNPWVERQPVGMALREERAAS